MLTLAFILPGLVALACLGLSQTVATRWLGLAAAAALLAGGGLLLAGRVRGGLPLVLAEYTWMNLDQRPLALVLRLDAFGWLPALVGLFGGGLALAVLALALPVNLRGFGGLFAAALAAIVASVLGLLSQGQLALPFVWALVALLGFLALRASGALARSDAPMVVLLAGLCSALVLLGAQLLGPLPLAEARVIVAALICWLLLGLLAFGAPPFHLSLQALAEAPAALAGALLALGLPLLGGAALIRFMAAQSVGVPPGWRLAFTLFGLLALFASAAGALGTTRLRRVLAWQFSAQLGALLIGLGQGGQALTAAAPAILLNSVLSTLVCFLALAPIERSAGSDEIAEIGLRELQTWPGALLLIGAASAVGLPGTWGFWPRRWLIDALLESSPWAVAPLLAGSSLLALAFVPALVVCWRREPAAPGETLAGAARAAGQMTSAAALVAVPLVVLGVAPQLAWVGWLAAAQAQLGGTVPPALPGWLAQLACALAALLLVGLPLLLRERMAGSSADSPAGLALAAAPQALGTSLRYLAWIGSAGVAFGLGWALLLRAAAATRRGLALFEQRYYLAGLLIAVIVVTLLFIQ